MLLPLIVATEYNLNAAQLKEVSHWLWTGEEPLHLFIFITSQNVVLRRSGWNSCARTTILTTIVVCSCSSVTGMRGAAGSGANMLWIATHTHTHAERPVALLFCEQNTTTSRSVFCVSEFNNGTWRQPRFSFLSHVVTHALAHTSHLSDLTASPLNPSARWIYSKTQDQTASRF